MSSEAFVVIMAGGTGTRFWPHSKEAHPKQFLDILGTGKTLLQMTFDRFTSFVPAENIYISTNERYEDLVKKQLPNLTQNQLLLEPAKRNTAPCIAYACYKIASMNSKAPIVIAPSDHAIFNEAAFQKTVITACQASDDQKLICIGIQPNRPATGYGYIKFNSTSDEVKKVNSFTEKPNAEVARQFLSVGDYVWNAGIFVWSGKAVKTAFEKHLPEMDKLFSQLSLSFYQPEERDVIKKQYLLSEDISIDYGILEKSDNVHVVLGSFGWSDLGAWASLHEYRDKDTNENVVAGDVIANDVKNSLILGQEGKMMVVQGLENFVVVDTPHSLLICQKDNEGVLKEAITQMKSSGKKEHL